MKQINEKMEYWDNVCAIQKRQTDKGIEKYGQILEQNRSLTDLERITYLQEELIDGLMYCEHLKRLIVSPVMTADQYQLLCLKTKAPMDFRETLLDCGLGLPGEAGEIADHIKKWAFQGHELNPEYIKKEIGDELWYLAVIAKELGFTLSECMEGNIDKLKKRYPDGFSIERSVNREEPVNGEIE